MQLPRLTFALACLVSPLLALAQNDSAFRLDPTGNQNINALHLEEVRTHAVETGQYAETADYLATKLKDQIQREGKALTEARLELLAQAVSYWKIFTVLDDAGVRANDETAKWLVYDVDRMRTFGLQFNLEKDHPTRAWQILKKLTTRLPQYRDEYANLIFAMALVWDQTPPNLHPNDKTPPPFTKDVLGLTQFFISSYEKNLMEINYRELGLRELLCVVGLPVAPSELIYAVKNVNGKPKRWRHIFHKMQIDNERELALKRQKQRQLGKANMPYTLENIETHGGSSEDVVYYTVVTARANGIPTLHFAGNTQDGGATWCGVYIGKDKWDLSIGDFERDTIAFGKATNPQTGEDLTDYDIVFHYDPMYTKGRYLSASKKMQLARFMYENGHKNVGVYFSQLMCDKAPLNRDCWALLETHFAEQKNQQALIKLHQKKSRDFRQFPDVSAESTYQLSKFMRFNRQPTQSQRLMDDLMRQNKRHNFDLCLKYATRFFEELVENRQHEEAFKFGLQFINDYSDNGAHIFDFIETFHNTGKQFPKKLIGYNRQIMTHFNDLTDRRKSPSTRTLIKIMRDAATYTRDQPLLAELKEIETEYREGQQREGFFQR